jgi:hypothetical protein
LKTLISEGRSSHDLHDLTQIFFKKKNNLKEHKSKKIIIEPKDLEFLIYLLQGQPEKQLLPIDVAEFGILT